MAEINPLTRVCALLNKHEAHYLIVSGHACILHGLVRTTEDVDILIGDSEDNFRRVIAELSELDDHAAAELTPQDLAENLVVKVADEVEVDISRAAWTVSYADAQSDVHRVRIDGVEVPYIGLRTLIATKETYREQGKNDVEKLRRLLLQ